MHAVVVYGKVCEMELESFYRRSTLSHHNSQRPSAVRSVSPEKRYRGTVQAVVRFLLLHWLTIELLCLPFLGRLENNINHDPSTHSTIFFKF